MQPMRSLWLVSFVSGEVLSVSLVIAVDLDQAVAMFRLKSAWRECHILSVERGSQVEVLCDDKSLFTMYRCNSHYGIIRCELDMGHKFEHMIAVDGFGLRRTWA
jgi:hypothetical protein